MAESDRAWTKEERYGLSAVLLTGLVIRFGLFTQLQGSYAHTQIFAAAIKAPGIIADTLTVFALVMAGERLRCYTVISIVVAVNIAMVLPIASIRPIYESTIALDRVLAAVLIVAAAFTTWMMLRGTSEQLPITAL